MTRSRPLNTSRLARSNPRCHDNYSSLLYTQRATVRNCVSLIIPTIFFAFSMRGDIYIYINNMYVFISVCVCVLNSSRIVVVYNNLPTNFLYLLTWLKIRCESRPTWWVFMSARPSLCYVALLYICYYICTMECVLYIVESSIFILRTVL